MSPQSSGPQYCLHSNPENNLAMSLPSEKEEIGFLWHPTAKATLGMFTKGRIPLLFCYEEEVMGGSVPWASPSLVLFKCHSL